MIKKIVGHVWFHQETIRAVRKSISLPLIVGGGLHSKAQIEAAFDAGADIVVVGTAIENNIHFLDEIKSIKK